MKKFILLPLLSLILFSCEKSHINIESEYIAEVAGIDPGCSACILAFPGDESIVRKNVGESPGNLYLATNLPAGDYKPGQKIKVTMRKAKTEELGPCSLQNSNGYQGIIVTSAEKFGELSLNDTINLPYHDCRFFKEDEFYVCLDSVLNDSRCPYGAYCFWEGNATVRFRYEKSSGEPVFFELNTYRQFRTDTIINGFVFRFTGLSPRPVTESKIQQKSYIAKIIVERE
jgi:hypothetical protein